MTTNDGTVGRYLGWFLVALSLGSGVIHFAVAGEHFDLTWYHGTFFAVVAWLQLVWATAIIVRPTRRLLALAALGNTAIIVVWFVSRMWGMPIGPDAGEPEPVALADAASTGFEAAIVLVSLAVLLQPALAQRSIRPRLGLAGIGTTTAAIAVVSTMALSPSFASEHHHGEAGHSHAAGEDAAAHSHGDDALAHVSTDDAAAHAAADAAGGAGHDHGGSFAISADGTSPCEQSGVANEGNSGGGSGHGHRGPSPYVPMDAATRQVFAGQMRQADAVIARYPTAADAEAAGYAAVTPYVPCIGAHFVNYAALANGFDPAQPEVVLYDGTGPDAHVVGLSYLQFGDPDDEPEGFAGDNDLWHVHSSLCIGQGGQVRGDEGTSDGACEDRGGRNIDLGDLWMNHTWNAPGYDSSWGLFSGENPLLGGTIGNVDG